MAANVQDEINHIVTQAGGITAFANVMRGYQICARTEGKSEGTIQIATTAMRRFKEFLDSHEYPTDVAQIDVVVLREFILHLQQARAFQYHPFTRQQDRGLSGHAINTYLRSIRAFWSWLVREELITSNPFARVKIPKPPKKVIATFSEKQLTDLLRIVDTSRPSGFRDWTMMMVLLDTGLRASELAGLTMDEVDMDEGMLKVHGKGNKERRVPVGARVLKALWKYIQRYRPEPANPLCTALFLTPTGRPITTDNLRGIVGRSSQKLGITGVRSSPHTFRHTFAISYLRNGGDVFSLQRILGHSSLEIVRLYVNLAEADVKACHRRFSPADNLGARLNI